MASIRTLNEFKQFVQFVIEGNEDSLIRYGKSRYTQPKIYLVESTRELKSTPAPTGQWASIDATGWYSLVGSQFEGGIFLDASHPRVWRLFSLVDAGLSDALVENWIVENHGLDHCWLSRKQLMAWEKVPGWQQRGLGLRFDDGLTPEEDSSNFSLKAWHGSRQPLPGLDELLEKAKDAFAIYSARWQKRQAGETIISAECYSDGKITINRSTDVDEVLTFSSAIADRYGDSLQHATNARRDSMAPFELGFTQKLDLDAFSASVAKAMSPMKLWLTEIEASEDFRRFRGVDLHTWDRLYLDLGLNYAYLTVPGKGCVNAAPRLATIQGENSAGRTSIYHNGVEIFG